MAALFGSPSDGSRGQRNLIMQAALSAPDDWQILFEVDWSDQRAGQSDCDVLVLTPSHGIVYLEVKGGRIEFHNNEWRQDGRRIDPFGQARNSQGALDHFLKSEYERKFGQRLTIDKQVIRKNTRLASWAGVWFPFSQPAAGATFPAGGNAPVVLGSNLTSTIQALGSLHVQLTDAFIENLVGLLAPRISFPGGSQILLTAAEIEEYSRQRMPVKARYVATSAQEEVITGVRSAAGRTQVVIGPAGSGKTLLAGHLAIDLAQSGRKVLLTARRGAVAAYLHQNISSFSESCGLAAENVTARSLEKTAMTVFGLSKPPDDRQLGALLSKGLGRHFDVVVVDEAEDLSEPWHLFISALAPTRVLLGDPQQSLSRHGVRLEEIAASPYSQVHRLTENLRSSGEVFRFTRRHTDINAENYQEAGPPPNVIKVDTATDVVRTVVSEINHLLEDGLTLDEMMLIVEHGSVDQWMGELKSHFRSLTKQPNAKGLLVADPFVARGFERPAVIAVLIHLDHAERVVAMTRAVSGLSVIVESTDRF